MPSSDDLGVQLAVLTGRGEGRGWVELRYRHGRGMRARFYPADGKHRALRALIDRQGPRTDVYIGCALRSRQQGSRAAVGEAWAVWAECDTPEASAAAQTYNPTPTLIVASGTPGHAHAYWALREPIGRKRLEDVNRRLATTFGADLTCCDPGRILRPCGAWSHKHTPPASIGIVGGCGVVYELPQITAHLPDGTAPALEVPAPCEATTDPLLAISPRLYVPALTHERLGADGKVRCPLHRDRTPSLHAYPDATRGWFCFGACCRGGSIIDLAAAIWSIEPRGEGYVEIRQRLLRLGLHATR